LAEPLVLLHGIGTGPEAWAPQVEAFAPTRRVLNPRVPLDLDRAHAELDALDVPRFDLCGLSWGGLVALRFALDRPERVRRLVAVAAFASLPFHLRALLQVLAAAVRVVPRAPHELAGPMRQGARFDVRERVRVLQAPLLVVCGERDRANRSPARALAGLAPNARFELIPDATHVANVDNPDAFTAVIERFLSAR
jgi:pimeloyl-ACP methyl ester carboxylesterase